MSFLFPTLLWIGLPLVAVPVVIHLLQRGRQERLPWAAMQFLIESQRKYQRWINLKQFLLLLTRMAVVALVAMLVAQPLLRANWAAMFSQRPVHHFVLLDDSFSMTDRDAKGSAWSSALTVLDSLIANTSATSRSAKITVLRFSDTMHNPQADIELFESELSAENADRIRAQIASWQASETNAEIADALQAGNEFLSRQTTGDDLVLHVVSDFRRSNWQDADTIARSLESAADKATGIELIQCDQGLHENVAITDLAIDAGVEAADVEVWFRISVSNFGSKPAEDVAADIKQDGRPQTAVSIGNIAPGESITKRFRAIFSGAGDHWLAAEIAPDAIELDNSRFYAARLPEKQKVLLVDGSPEGQEASFLATALAPGGRTHTGWETVIETPSALSRYNDFSSFAAVALLSVPRVPNEVLDRLEAYVRDGGGVWIAVDDTVDREFYNNEFYRDGAGLLALPLKFPAQLEPRSADSDADLTVSSHPALRVLSGARNDYLPLASVQMFYETRGQEGAIPAEIRLLATLRNGAPWMAEKRLGKGIAISQFSRLSPIPTRIGTWSNMAVNPVFPVLANEITAYLARNGANRPLFQVGDQWTPADSQPGGISLTRIEASSNERNSPATAPVDATGQLRQSGLFQVESRQHGKLEYPSLIAVNVMSNESDLAYLSREELDSRIGDVSPKIKIWLADELSARPESKSAGRLADALLVGVLGLLVGEQALAYWSSYHRRRSLQGDAA